MSAPVVLVVGASGGIGRAVALGYAGRGAQLVLAARSRGRLEDLAADCRAQGAEAVPTVCDVSDAASVRDAVDLALERFGRLDIAVHTPAVVTYGRLTQVPADVWDHALDVGIHGTATVAREVLRVFESRGSGNLVVIGSVLGQMTAPLMSSYVASKWAVRGLVRVLQQEARQTPGVHVALVSPGSIDTGIYGLAATYVGHPGSPPPPVLRPEAVARAVLRVVDKQRLNANVGALNPLMRLGFTLVPRLFDVLVGPLFQLLGLGRELREPSAGNVFLASEDVDRHGAHLDAVENDGRRHSQRPAPEGPHS